MKLLFIDIETSPNTATVWGLWNQNVAINQLLESSYTLCWAAKWKGESEIMFESVHQTTPKQMVRKAHTLLNEADVVVHYHGSAFDIPTLNKEFLLHGMTPPAPTHEIDLLKVVRQKFRFPSNRLDYVCDRLKLGRKYEHEGHTLWVKCMNDDAKAWVEMERYNRHDVVLLEKLYEKLVPWMKNHATHGLFSPTSEVCPKCGSAHYQKRGLAYTKQGRYQRYQCLGCGGWFRGSASQVKGGFVAL